MCRVHFCPLSHTLAYREKTLADRGCLSPFSTLPLLGGVLSHPPANPELLFADALPAGIYFWNLLLRSLQPLAAWPPPRNLARRRRISLDRRLACLHPH